MQERRTDQRVTFYLSANGAGRINVLFALRGFAFLAVSITMIAAIVQKFMEHPMAFSIALVFCLLLLGAGVRFILRIFDNEYLEIDKDSLSIYSTQNLKKRTWRYAFGEISNIAYVGADKSTDHPLKGNSIDHLGFEARDKEIDAVNKTGKICLMSGERRIFFGRELYSWDAKKISDCLYEMSIGSVYIQDLPAEISEMVYKFSK